MRENRNSKDKGTVQFRSLGFDVLYLFRVSGFALFFSSIVSWAADPLSPDLKGFKDSIVPLVQKHCTKCHGAKEQKGDVRLDTLDGNMVEGKSVSLWKDVLHRLEIGEMPPKEESAPTQAERDAWAQWIRGELRKHLTVQNGAPGRVVLRRLSRREYRNTMRDLLGLDYDIGRELAPDTTYHGFDHVASVQELSRSQLETYLKLARFAVDKAIVTGERPMSFSYRAEPEQDKAGLHWRVNSHGNPEHFEMAAAFTKGFYVGRGEKKMEPDQWAQTHRFAIKSAQGRFGDNKDYLTETGLWLKAPQQAYAAKGGDWGRIGLRLPHVPRDDSLYRLRIKAGAKRQAGLGTPLLTIHVFKKLLANVEITASADRPEWYEFVFAERDLTDVQIHSDDNRFAKTPVTDIVLNNGYENPGIKKGRNWQVPKEVEIPGVFVDSIEFETHYAASWPPPSHRQVLFDSPKRDQPEQYAAEVLKQFMSRAFRRPVREEELQSKLMLFRRTFATSSDFITAIKEPLVATLVSPQFLFLTEDAQRAEGQRRPLNSHELASRLSYFLWSTMPDEELLKLADRGVLGQPHELRQQIDRLLKDPRATALHDGFTEQWLGLKKLDDLMIEDERWVVRTGLRESMRAEPSHFFAELLRGNLSLMNLVDSDFAMINERLAQHYKIPGVYGNQFRKVNLKPEHARGGLLTQAASMAITTDGMITSPIYRGKWVMEKILDLPPPPPPPNVPPLDDAPEERLSLRAQLKQHREDANCAACHKKIDPIGWPFERYSILGEYSNYGWGPNWVQFHDPKRNRQDERPELYGTLTDGTRVETVRDVQRAILERHGNDVLRSVVKHMMIYALGRPLDVTDDETIRSIVKTLESRNYLASELVYAIVLSKPFLEK